MELEKLGWNSHFQNQFSKAHCGALVPARLSSETKIDFTAQTENGPQIAVVSGKLWHEAKTDADLPAVGDWVGLQINQNGGEHLIQVRLPRLTTFSRKAPGNIAQEQVIAANIDFVGVVTAPGTDFNLRRIERYLTLIERGGAEPLILLNKIDLISNQETAHHIDAISQLREQLTILPVSATASQGLAELEHRLRPNKTITLVGSSGVGKSTLTNALLKDEWQDTNSVNEITGKGRHTTVTRELHLLPRGGILIDNPGIREVQMWTDEASLRASFEDIEELSRQCQFRDCSHTRERNCALITAMNNGTLSPERYNSYLRLEEEIAQLNRRIKKRQIATERWKKRNHRVKARNLNDRIQLEKDLKGEL